jgi:cell division protein FtsL
MPPDTLTQIRRLTAARAGIETEWRQLIQAAIADGYRVAEIAEAAGITATRVYQIRDNRR